MKKILFILGFLVTVGVSTTFANDEKVSPKALASFKAEFSTAQNVEWETGTNYFRAIFTLNERKVFAYYNLEGELISVARYISSIQLPINLFSNLKNQYGKYWISDLFEVSNGEGLHYYVTLETADTKLMLHSANGGAWSTYSKNKKS
jgi:hypothetical protein